MGEKIPLLIQGTRHENYLMAQVDRKFRVGLSADFFDADKKVKFPDFDLTPLKTNPDVEMVVVQVDFIYLLRNNV